MKRGQTSPRRVAIGLALIVGLVTSPGSADACTGIIFEFNQLTSGSSPSGAPAWFSALFEDVAPGAVRLTISAINVSPTDKVTELYLNLNPSFRATDLRFSEVHSSPGVTPPVANLGTDMFRAGTEGRFDLIFTFSQQPQTAFGVGAQMSAWITGPPSLSAADFATLSTPDTGQLPFYAALHIQDMSAQSTSDTSAPSMWVAPSDAEVLPVPEPSATLLTPLALGLVGGRKWWLKRAGRA